MRKNNCLLLISTKSKTVGLIRILLSANYVVSLMFYAAVYKQTLKVLSYCLNMAWVSLSITDVFCVKHVQSVFLTHLSLLSGGILAGLISDKLEKRASTCGMMLLLAAPTVRVCPSLTAAAETLTAFLGKFCKQHLLTWI